MAHGMLSAYELDRRDFRLEVPERFNFVRDVLARWAEDPKKRALLWVDERGNRQDLTFRQMVKRSSRLADGLARLGVKKGDRVLVVIPPEPAWWETFMALLKLGAIVAPGTSQLTPRDIQYRMNLAEASAIIVEEASAAKADESLGDRQAVRVVVGKRKGWNSYEDVVSSGSESFEGEATRCDDPAILYFTSGTTGHPKMVLHTQASYPVGHTITGKFWLDLTPDDLHWNLSDTGWAKAAWSSLFGPWNTGSAAFVFRQYGKPDPHKILSQFAEHQVTSFCGAPTIYRMLVQTDLTKYRYDSLRSCVAAGEPLNPEVIDAWKRATGMTIRDGYGQTETVVLVANFPGTEVRPCSMGKPSPGFTVDVVGDDGQPLEANKEGDIAVRVKPERPVGLFREYKYPREIEYLEELPKTISGKIRRVELRERKKQIIPPTLRQA